MHISCPGEQLGPGTALPFAPSQQAKDGSLWAEVTHPAPGLGCSRPSAPALLHNRCYEENSITEVICRQKCTLEECKLPWPEVPGWPRVSRSAPGGLTALQAEEFPGHEKSRRFHRVKYLNIYCVSEQKEFYSIHKMS